MSGTAVVIGAGGFLGHRLCAIMADDAYHNPVIAVTRRDPDRPLFGAQLHIVDRQNPDIVESLLATGPASWFDTAVNDIDDATALIEGARRIAATGRALPRFVITSTIGEFGPALSSRTTITADTPTSADDCHSAGKLRALEVLRSRGGFMSITWAILPQMWGPNDHQGQENQGRTTRIIEAVSASKPVYFRETADNTIPDGYVDTIAQGLTFLARTSTSTGLKRILVAGPIALTPRGFVMETAHALSATPEIEVLPQEQLVSVVGRDYKPVFPEYDLKLDVSELYDAGFRPSTDWKLGVHRTAVACTTRGNHN